MKKEENMYSFKKGFGHVQNKDVSSAKRDIMKVLGISSRAQWYQRLYGKVIPNVEEKENIEKVFSKYRVKQSDIWGN